MSEASTAAHPKEIYAAAMQAREAGDLERAKALLEEMVAAYPGKKHIVAQAAKGLRACGLWVEAVHMLEAALERAPVSPQLLMALAAAHMEAKSFARAGAYIERHLARDPSDPSTWLFLARVREQENSWAAVETAYARALALAPLNFEAALGHGDVLYRLGRNDDAIAAYRRAVSLSASDSVALFKLGSLLMHAGMPEAEEVLRRAIVCDPANTDAHVNLALALHQAGRSAEAEAMAQEAAGLEPPSAAAYSTLGTILLELGKFPEAAAALRRAAELDPLSVMVLTALATVENSLGKRFDAERALQRILSIEPNNLEARHLLSAIHGEPVRSVPAGYSQQLFDWFAPRFDRLLAGLKYQAPQAVAALLAELASARGAFKRWLDLGCGTGLVAEALAARYDIPEKVGVDVSGRMIEAARAKALYDELVQGDAGEVLAARPGHFDLVTAIDMFIYVGDLAQIIPAIARGLAPGGVFVYSIETMPEGKYKLQKTGRFAHATKYVEDSARASGLTSLVATPVTLRVEMGADVPGVIGAFKR